MVNKDHLAGKHILIVEDDRMVAGNLQAYLQDVGCTVVCAFSSNKGLEAIKKSKKSFDIGLIDLYLPINEGDKPELGVGIKLAETIHTQSKHTRLIGISLFHDENIGKALSRHFAGFIKKGELFGGDNDPSSTLLELLYSYSRKRGRRKKPNIFIVHGHDNKTKHSLKNYILDELKLGEPIILDEKPSAGRTIIEKFEELTKKVDVVFVVLTPDDKGAAIVSPLKKFRARQNVIFEMGYFLGKLQRKGGKVILLYKDDIELPSDVAGIIYIDISNGIKAADEIIKRELMDWL